MAVIIGNKHGYLRKLRCKNGVDCTVRHLPERYIVSNNLSGIGLFLGMLRVLFWRLCAFLLSPLNIAVWPTKYRCLRPIDRRRHDVDDEDSPCWHDHYLRFTVDGEMKETAYVCRSMRRSPQPQYRILHQELGLCSPCALFVLRSAVDELSGYIVCEKADGVYGPDYVPTICVDLARVPADGPGSCSTGPFLRTNFGLRRRHESDSSALCVMGTPTEAPPMLPPDFVLPYTSSDSHSDSDTIVPAGESAIDGTSISMGGCCCNCNCNCPAPMSSTGTASPPGSASVTSALPAASPMP